MDDLIAKLEAAESGSRELDIELMVLLGGARDVGDGVFYGPNTETWHTSDAAESEGYWMLPAPSSSLDAALALAERVYPDGWLDLTIREQTARASQCFDGNEGYHGPRHASPAIAVCLAILKATREKSNG